MQYRIGFISEHASPLAALGGIDAGGQNVYVGELAEQLAALGYVVDIFTRMDNAKLPAIVQWMPGVRVIHVKAGPAAFLPKEQLLDCMPAFRDEMEHFIAKHHLRYALMHANFFMSALVACELKARLHIPFVVTFHALGHVRRLHQGEADQFPASRLTIEEEIVRQADQIIAECPQDREDLIQHYHALPERITMIPCGFDPAEFFPVDKQLARMLIDLDPEEPMILQLGRMVPRKGVDNVIRAMGLLKNKVKALRLVIVGGAADDPEKDDNPEVARLKKIATEMGIEARITFAGRRSRERLKYFYSAADIFITTPWYEPFGITPLEAMACGTPVIGANVGGIKFSVADDKTGFLVPPKDPEALAEKIETLISNPSLCEKMGRQAVLRVNSLFTWACVARKMSSVYQHILLSKSKLAEHTNSLQLIDEAFVTAAQTTKRTGQALRVQILTAGNCMAACLRKGNKIMICGNGSSAVQSQQFASGLIGRSGMGSRALAVMALLADTAAVTACANNMAYEEIYARQVEAYGQAGDLLICLSTSGNSRNILNAMAAARKRGIYCIGLLGRDGGEAIHYTDMDITVPALCEQRIRELHLTIIHTLTAIVENELGMSKAGHSIAKLHPVKGINIAV